jgi:plastocyanin
MTSRWRISFSLTVLQAFAATVAGRVSLTDSKSKDFSGVVVWLDPVNGPPVLPRPAGHAQILQKNKKFSPHILAVTTGTIVDFPNNDPIFHNAFSNFEGKVFDIGLYPPGTSKSVRLDRPGVVRVFCNIHPTMSAIVAVLSTPYFAISKADGRFQIADVPPGEYTLHVMHERATPATLDGLARRVTVHDDLVNLPVLAISESGSLPQMHKNKYGKDYPPVAEDSFYPGAKK